jgi:hypothetical protein
MLEEITANEQQHADDLADLLQNLPKSLTHQTQHLRVMARNGTEIGATSEIVSYRL